VKEIRNVIEGRSEGCIVCGDCLEIMKDMSANTIDSIVTDPPYGLEFMGKEWDKLTRNLMNPSSKADKKRKDKYARNYAGRRSNLPDYTAVDKFAMQDWHCRWAKAALRVAKPGAILMAFGGTRTHHRLMCAIEDAGWEIRDTIMWMYGSGFPKSLDISKAIDKAKGAYKKGRILPSSRKTGASITSIATTFREKTATNPQTNLAKVWGGWGTALKPAWEPVVVAMKPLDGTFAQNAEKWGVAGLWVDGGRINTKECLGRPKGQEINVYERSKHKEPMLGKITADPQGRWPANVILDEEVGKLLDEQSGVSKDGVAVRHHSGGNTFGGNSSKPPMDDMTYGGSGGASRFFYCAKASRAERGEDNNHPTVKPLALMKYLCRLTMTPTSGIVLDPFCGSGTTCVAAKKLGRKWIGIDIEPKYVEIARQRVQNTPRPLFQET